MQSSQDLGIPPRHELGGMPFPHPAMNADPGPNAPPNAPILPALTLALTNLHDHTLEKLQHIGVALGTLSVSVTHVREKAHEDTLKLAEWLERSHVRQMKATQGLLERVEALERVVGKTVSLHEDDSLTGRLKRIDYVLNDLLESAQDPNAALEVQPAPGIHKNSSTATRDLVEQGVDPIVPMTVHVDASIDVRVPNVVDAGVDALSPALVDAATNTRPVMLIDAGIDAQQRVYMDAAIETVKTEYTTTGTDPCVPEASTDISLTQTAEMTPPTLSELPLFSGAGCATTSNAGYSLQARFPTSPYNSDPMVPAKWTPPQDDNSNTSSSDQFGSPNSQLSYLALEEVLERSAFVASSPSGGQEIQDSPAGGTVAKPSALPTGASPKQSAFEPSSDEGGFLTEIWQDDEVTVSNLPLPTSRAPSPTGTIPSAADLPNSRSPSTPASNAMQTASSPTAVDPNPSMRPSVDGSASPSSQALSGSTSASAPPPLPRNMKGLSKPRGDSNPTSSTSSQPLSVSPSSNSPISLSSMSSLTSSSPELSPPQRVPLPRRSRASAASHPHPQPQRVQSQSRLQTARTHSKARARSHSADAPRHRESSSEVEIIERPANFVAKTRNRDKSLGKKRGVEPRTRTREARGEGRDVGRPRKRRKTDGDALAPLPAPKPRGRPRKTLDVPAGRQTTAASASTSKRKLHADDVPCQWPAKINGDIAFQREFVQCDNCDAWYHFGCVGLVLDDPLLETDAEFMCPPCQVSQQQRQRRHVNFVHDAACGRPDCDYPGVAAETNEWFVDRIVGRRPQAGDNEHKPNPAFLWLVKWDGWTVTEASWTLPENLGDASRYIAEFEVAAAIEGHSLRDPHAIVVLNEAAVCGW